MDLGVTHWKKNSHFFSNKKEGESRNSTCKHWTWGETYLTSKITSCVTTIQSVTWVSVMWLYMTHTFKYPGNSEKVKNNNRDTEAVAHCKPQWDVWVDHLGTQAHTVCNGELKKLTMHRHKVTYSHVLMSLFTFAPSNSSVRNVEILEE